MTQTARSLNHSLSGPQSLWGLCFCVVLACGVCLSLLSPSFIVGQHPFWMAQNEDVALYRASFNAFFHEPWHWPLWRVESLNWPNGTLITFADNVPLYAALLKVLLPQTWFPFNPYGVWIAICFCLQGCGAWLIARAAEMKSWVALGCLCLLLLSFPAWLNRIGHVSLFPQWLILFAYALVIANWKTQRLTMWLWTTLLCVAFLINFYLCVMLGVLLLTQLPIYFQRATLKSWFTWIISSALLFGFIIYATMWPLPKELGGTEGGFNLYSLNLMAPFSGGSILSFPNDAHSPEQRFEGRNYLGIGGLMLAAIALALTLRDIKKNHAPSLRSFSCRSRIYLWIGLLCVSGYALSNRIYFGELLLYEWSMPDWMTGITGQLRAPGRMFWIVGYAIIIFSVIVVAKKIPTWCSNYVLVCLTLLQLVDLFPKLQQVRSLNASQPTPLLDSRQWQSALSKNIHTLYFFPKMRCAQRSSFLQTLLPTMLFASERGLNLNTSYSARYFPPCKLERDEIAQSDPNQSAYIFVNAEYTPTEIHHFFPKDWDLQCASIDFATLCTKRQIPQ